MQCFAHQEKRWKKEKKLEKHEKNYDAILLFNNHRQPLQGYFLDALFLQSQDLDCIGALSSYKDFSLFVRNFNAKFLFFVEIWFLF